MPAGDSEVDAEELEAVANLLDVSNLCHLHNVWTFALVRAGDGDRDGEAHAEALKAVENLLESYNLVCGQLYDVDGGIVYTTLPCQQATATEMMPRRTRRRLKRWRICWRATSCRSTAPSTNWRRSVRVAVFHL